MVAGRRQRQDWVEASRGSSGGGEGGEDGEIGDLLLLQCSAAAPAGKDCCRSGRYIFLRKCCLLDWGGKLREKGFFLAVLALDPNLPLFSLGKKAQVKDSS